MAPHAHHLLLLLHLRRCLHERSFASACLPAYAVASPKVTCVSLVGTAGCWQESKPVPSWILEKLREKGREAQRRVESGDRYDRAPMTTHRTGWAAGLVSALFTARALPFLAHQDIGRGLEELFDHGAHQEHRKMDEGTASRSCTHARAQPSAGSSAGSTLLADPDAVSGRSPRRLLQYPGGQPTDAGYYCGNLR